MSFVSFPPVKCEVRAKGPAIASIISAIRSPSHVLEKVCTTRLRVFVYSFARSTCEPVSRQMLQQAEWLQLENGKVLAMKHLVVAANIFSGAGLVCCFILQYVFQYWYLGYLGCARFFAGLSVACSFELFVSIKTAGRDLFVGRSAGLSPACSCFAFFISRIGDH